MEKSEADAISVKKTLKDVKITHESEISKLNAELLSVQTQLKKAQSNVKESKEDYELYPRAPQYSMEGKDVWESRWG